MNKIMSFSFFIALLINVNLQAGPVYSNLKAAVDYYTEKTVCVGHTHGYGQPCHNPNCVPPRYITQAKADEEERKAKQDRLEFERQEALKENTTMPKIPKQT